MRKRLRDDINSRRIRLNRFRDVITIMGGEGGIMNRKIKRKKPQRDHQELRLESEIIGDFFSTFSVSRFPRRLL